ncbi:MAG: hypothetical protein MUE46_06030 [Xanthomonadales bacterium]|jgi:hypothetical protein|nr:hypothetical protein [Xanthomonadales bacterium]
MTVRPPADFAAVLGLAHTRLCERLRALAPGLAAQLLPWIESRAARGLPAADYFTHPLAFPLVQLPWWLEESLVGAVDPQAQTELLISSMSGYYLIRLIDDVMDRSPEAKPRLLPAVAVLHEQFQSAYLRHFDGAHPFWPRFREVWARCQEAAVLEAHATEIDEAAFAQLSARKVSAGIIPLEAVAWRCGLSALPSAWAELFPRLCAFHQRYNDLYDWQRDLQNGAVTGFLTLVAKRRRADESMLAWVAREGYALESARLAADLAALEALAADTGSRGLADWLRQRRVLLQQADADARAGLAAAFQLQQALSAARPAPRP